jgi:hypothetical protein
MTDKLLASFLNSACLFNHVAHTSSNFCVNCDNLKSELQKKHDELKSAYLIIHVLQKEVKSSNVSDCINVLEQKYRNNNFIHKECCESNTNDWIQV